MIPRHLMRMSVWSIGANGQRRRALHLQMREDRSHPSSGLIKGLGIVNREDGLIIAGPAVAYLLGEASIPAKWGPGLAGVDAFELEVVINMAGTGRDLRINQRLSHDNERYLPKSIREWRYFQDIAD